MCLHFACYAQSDVQQKGDSSTQLPYENKDDNLYKRQGDMVAVSADVIPLSLKTTLKQSRYRGWEKGDLLRSSDGKIYEFAHVLWKKDSHISL